MAFFLIVSGLFFPVISWITLALSIFFARAGRSTSGVYIPLIGPVLLSVWLVRAGEPNWMLLLPWILDIGTVFFFAAAPGLIREYWQTSRFTRTFKLAGTQGDQTVEISFHQGGRYFLTKRWNRSMGETAVIAMSEPGTYSQGEILLNLCSLAGRTRHLALEGSGYVVSDAGATDDLQIQGWQLIAKLD